MRTKRGTVTLPEMEFDVEWVQAAKGDPWKMRTVSGRDGWFDAQWSQNFLHANAKMPDFVETAEKEAAKAEKDAAKAAAGARTVAEVRASAAADPKSARG